MSGREPTRALKRRKANQVRGSMPTSIARKAIRGMPPTGIDAQASRSVETRSIRCVIVLNLIDLGADRIATHQSRIVGLQYLRHSRNVRESWIEPEIIVVWMKYHRHSVVNLSSYGVWCRGQDRAGLGPVPTRVLPTLPESGESKQLAVVDLEAVWLFGFPGAQPFVEPIRRNQAPAIFQRVTECRLGGR